ncbi:ABC transporter ATP-binding protein [Trinickia diaoshuihuensis]|uniref:ATP-binding cassette domain-containing protein n=1 Tax=Trinickia diaoshuihuensis TaxID=2292265 RepID=UPI000E26CCDF|nr:ABC transporter ATP-binding protein [Trinickia diaoshuihuensis]
MSALSLIAAFLGLIPAVAFGITIDKVIYTHSIRNLLFITFALFAGHFAEMAIATFDQRMSSALIRQASERLRFYVIGLLEGASLIALEEQAASLILRRVRSIDKIVAFYLDWYRSLMTVPIFVVAISTFVVIENWILGAGMVLLTVVYVYAYWRVNRQLKAQYQLESRERDTDARRMSEFVHGLITLRMAGKIGAFRRDLREQQESTQTLREQRMRRISALRQLSSGYMRLAIIVLLTVGSLLVFRHSLSIGHLVAINLIFRRVLSEARGTVPLIQRLHQTGHDVDQVLELLDVLRKDGREDIEPEVPEVPDFGRIVVSGLRFRYPGGHADILKSVDFSIRAGELVAVVGGSGAGKTSLLKLLCGLYPPTAGQVAFADGVKGRRLRYSIATPLDTLFNRSVNYNITLGGVLEADAVHEAARIAAAADFIGAMDRAYDTELHHDGRNLSQGQKQRLSLARCFATDAPFVLLDEPTSALDKMTEAAVVDNLLRLRGKKTIVMVTHRLAPALAADTVVMLERGVVVEWGPRAALLAKPDGLFRRWVTETRLGEHALDVQA